MIDALLLVIGFFLVIKGADFLVIGASNIAKKYHVSELFIGLTIVSLGTSMPEFAVNLISSIHGKGNIALGNIIGSNLSNILLILGLSSIFAPLIVKKSTLTFELPQSIIAPAVLLLLANNFVNYTTTSVLGKIDGIILLSLFGFFIYKCFKRSKDHEVPEQNDEQPISKSKSVLLILLGLAMLAIGGDWIVKGAIAIANFLGVSDSLIALTIVAIGGSVPELATSIVAALKKKVDIAVGNILGSNIFNIYFILGFSSLINPIKVKPMFNTDMFFLLTASLILVASMFIGKKRVLTRKKGLTFVLIYASYIGFIILRG